MTHTTWALKNNVVTSPTHGNEFMVSMLDVSPIKVFETFEKKVTSYPTQSEWVQEFADQSAMWSSSNDATSSVFRGTYQFHSDYSLTTSAEGLRMCYGRFYNGESRPVTGLTNRVGAACCLVSSTQVAT